MTLHAVSTTMAHNEQDEVEAMLARRHQERASAHAQHRQRLACAQEESERGAVEVAATAALAECRRIQGESECMSAKVGLEAHRLSEGAPAGTGHHASSAPAVILPRSHPIAAKAGWQSSEMDIAATSLQRVKWRRAPGLVDPQIHSSTFASISELRANSQGAEPS